MPGGSPVSCRWTTCCGWPATSRARSPEPGAARGTPGSPIEPQPTQDRAGTFIPQAVEAGLQEAGDLVVARLVAGTRSAWRTSGAKYRSMRSTRGIWRRTNAGSRAEDHCSCAVASRCSSGSSDVWMARPAAVLRTFTLASWLALDRLIRKGRRPLLRGPTIRSRRWLLAPKWLLGNHFGAKRITSAAGACQEAGLGRVGWTADGRFRRPGAGLPTAGARPIADPASLPAGTPDVPDRHRRGRAGGDRPGGRSLCWGGSS